MGFANPYFLFGLFALLIPIAVHFFNFHRYKKVYFTNVSVLREIEIKSKKQNQLYKWLLLLFRCLTIVFLVLLFSQPYLKNDEKSLVKDGKNIVVVFVDNSFSSPLDKAKSKAKEIVDLYSIDDKFCLLTMDLAGKERHFVDKQRVLSLIKEVETTPCSRMMSEVFNTAHKILENENGNNKICFFISDFQRSCLDEENFKQDSLSNIFVPLENKGMDNVFIDSLWTDTKSIMKGRVVDLKVKVVNSSQQAKEKIPLKLFVDNKQVAVASVDLNEDEKKVISLSFTVENEGVLHSKVDILDSPVVFDNQYYFTLLVSDKIRVLSLNERKENPYLMRLFDDQAEVKIDNVLVANPDYNSFNSYSLIILNGLERIDEGLANELRKFVENSGSLMIIPTKEMDLESVNAFLNSMSLPYYAQLKEQTIRVNKFDNDNFLFKDVFSTYIENISLPTSKMYFPIVSSSFTAKQSVLTYSNYDDFLAISPKSSSNVYMFSVGLDTAFSDFVNNSLFVPILWNSVALSEVNPQLYYTIGEREFVELVKNENISLNDEIISVKSKTDSLDFIPQLVKNQKGYALKLYNQVNKSGNFDIVLNDSVISGFSLNYPSRESIMEFTKKTDVSKELKSYSSEKKFPFAFIFVLLALVSILCETILMYKLNKLSRNEKK